MSGFYDRFARFINGETHITDEEISLYETSFQLIEPMSGDDTNYITDDELEDEP